MAHGYAYANALAGLAASAFTWSPSVTTNRSFLNDGEMAKQFELSTALDFYVVIDLGAPASLCGFALLNHNATSGQFLVIQGADDSGITTNVASVYSQALDSNAPTNKDHVALFSATGRRYWKIRILSGASISFKIGEIFGIYTSQLVSLTRKKIYGHGESEQYFINAAKSDTGWSRATFLAGPQRTKRLPFSDLTLTERRALLTMWRASYGGANPLLWIEDTTTPGTASTQECLWGRPSTSLDWSEDDYGVYSPSEISIESLGREAGS